MRFGSMDLGLSNALGLLHAFTHEERNSYSHADNSPMFIGWSWS
jgi:hypothetical protein